jgi:predicted transcriptional regulator
MGRMPRIALRSIRATSYYCKIDLDLENRREPANIRHILGAMMATKEEKPSLLDVVALLSDLPAQRLARGQVGTIVEQLDENISLVEFSDEHGRAYAIAPCPLTELLTLHYVPEAAWSYIAENDIVKLPEPDISEDRRRLDEFKRTGLAVPLDEIKAWVASWGSANELPRPLPRKIG